MADRRTRFNRWPKLPAVESIELSEGQSSTTTLVPRRHSEAGADDNLVPTTVEPPEEDHQSTLLRNGYGFRTL